MKSLLPRLAWASAGLAVACGLASRATANDAAPLPCPEPCPPVRTVCAPTPKVIVEVPPPNIIIRASAAPCAPEHKETLFQKICHFSCHPHSHHRAAAPQMFVQPAPMQFVQQAPMQFVQQAPVQFAQAPAQFVQPAPVSFAQAPVSFAQAPMQFVQQAPVSFAQAPMQFVQQAPTQFLVPGNFVVGGANNFQGGDNRGDSRAESKADATKGETCDAALRKVTNQMETLTKVVEAHTQVLISHEERLQSLERWATDINKSHPKATPAPAAGTAGVLPTFPQYVPPAKKAGE